MTPLQALQMPMEVWWTKDKTLVRKVNVKSGVMSNPVLFDPTSEWDSLAMNIYT